MPHRLESRGRALRLRGEPAARVAGQRRRGAVLRAAQAPAEADRVEAVQKVLRHGGLAEARRGLALPAADAVALARRRLLRGTPARRAHLATAEGVRARQLAACVRGALVRVQVRHRQRRRVRGAAGPRLHHALAQPRRDAAAARGRVGVSGGQLDVDCDGDGALPLARHHLHRQKPARGGN